ncbi:hypothetical protein RHO12_00275 [Orbus sturtevantii]|uniref:OB-fold protein n=1 Tax=Orbus sturtevantii TaxID=3074109 RepID=UPI00370DB04C
MKKLWLLLIFLPLFTFAQDDMAKKMTYWFINKNINDFLQNKVSNLDNSIPTVTAEALIQDYKDNQLSYEEKYDEAIVRIQDVVAGIKTTVMKQAYLQVKGKNNFESISLYVDRTDKNILSLKKGDKIDMVCMGTNNNVIYPRLMDCDFTVNYSKKLKAMNQEYIEYLATKKMKAKYLIGGFYQAFCKILQINDKLNETIKSAPDFDKSMQKFKFNQELINLTFSMVASDYSEQELNKMPWFILPTIK